MTAGHIAMKTINISSTWVFSARGIRRGTYTSREGASERGMPDLLKTKLDVFIGLCEDFLRAIYGQRQQCRSHSFSNCDNMQIRSGELCCELMEARAERCHCYGNSVLHNDHVELLKISQFMNLLTPNICYKCKDTKIAKFHQKSAKRP